MFFNGKLLGLAFFQLLFPPFFPVLPRLSQPQYSPIKLCSSKASPPRKPINIMCIITSKNQRFLKPIEPRFNFSFMHFFCFICDEAHHLPSIALLNSESARSYLQVDIYSHPESQQVPANSLSQTCCWHTHLHGLAAHPQQCKYTAEQRLSKTALHWIAMFELKMENDCQVYESHVWIGNLRF